MTKFQKIQRWVSFVPFLGPLFVCVATMIQLRIKKAPGLYNLLWFLISAVGFSLLMYTQELLVSGIWILKLAVDAGISGIMGILFVELQVRGEKAQAKKNRKGLPSWVYATGLGLVLAAVVLANLLNSLLNPPVIKYEDTNGPENTNLALITDEQMREEMVQCTAVEKTKSFRGNRTDTEDWQRAWDWDIAEEEIENISGILPLQVTKVSSDTVTLEITSVLHKGNMEIKIFIDDFYYDDVPINTTQKITLTGIANKTIVVKLGAEDAELGYKVVRHIGE